MTNLGTVRAVSGTFAAILLMMAVAACGDGAANPVAPTPQFPQVAGTYSGPFTLSSSTFGSVTGYAEIVVVQVGAQVTLTGTTTLNGQTEQLAALTGTINATGFFTATAGGSDVRALSASPSASTCGTWDVFTATRTFVGRTLQIEIGLTTTYCGIVTWSATLSR